jgi:hypothetical protein
LAPAEALAQDAAEYASHHDVSVEEALRRLQAQEETVAATDLIQEKYKRRLAGIAIEHHPAYRIVVLLTGSKRVPSRTVSAGGMKVPIVFRTGARATRERIVAAIRGHQGAIRSAFSAAQGMGADPRTGELVLLVRSGDVEPERLPGMSERLERLTGVPSSVRLLEGAQENSAVEGGARVAGIEPTSGRRQFCTTGFVVTDGERTGVVTAAHCPDSLTYHAPNGGEIPLSFDGQWGWSFQDVQVHVSPEAQRPVFYADTAKTAARTLAGSRTRASTRAGDAVCHRGETTGYSCSVVELVDYAPPGDLCGGPCAPVWVTVRGPSCRGGDSGGPVFSGGVAFGIMKGGSYARSGRCNFYFYMSTDYLPEGWSLLREARPAEAAELAAATD